MYLKRAPASFGFGVVCPGDLKQQGAVILARLVQAVTEKLSF